MLGLLGGARPELLLALRWEYLTGLLLTLFRDGLPELLLKLRREDLTGLRLGDLNGDLLDVILAGLRVTLRLGGETVGLLLRLRRGLLLTLLPFLLLGGLRTGLGLLPLLAGVLLLLSEI